MLNLPCVKNIRYFDERINPEQRSGKAEPSAKPGKSQFLRQKCHMTQRTMKKAQLP
jgi:hypothetical protein